MSRLRAIQGAGLLLGLLFSGFAYGSYCATTVFGVSCVAYQPPSSACGWALYQGIGQSCDSSAGGTTYYSTTGVTGDGGYLRCVKQGVVYSEDYYSCSITPGHQCPAGYTKSGLNCYPDGPDCSDELVAWADAECDCPNGLERVNGYCKATCIAHPNGTKKSIQWENLDIQPSITLCLDNCKFQQGLGFGMSDGYYRYDYESTGENCGTVGGPSGPGGGGPPPPGDPPYIDEGATVGAPPTPDDPACEGEFCFDGANPVDAPGVDWPDVPGCNRGTDGTLRCFKNSADGPEAGGPEGPTVRITGENGETWTASTPQEGGGGVQGPPPGTPFDTNNDGAMDGVVGSDGLVYPVSSGGGVQPGSEPVLDPNEVPGTGCVDNPLTSIDECDDSLPDPGAICIEDPDTWISECTDTGENCVDDPTTFENECHPGFEPDGGDGEGEGDGECVDDPETPENECEGDGSDEGVGLGDCEQEPECEGSVFDCPMIRLQWETACQFHVSDVHLGQGDSLVDPGEYDDGEFLWSDIGDVLDLEVLSLGMPAATECPPPYVLSILGSTYEVDFGPMCTILNLAGIFIFIGAGLVSVRIVTNTG